MTKYYFHKNLNYKYPYIVDVINTIAPEIIMNINKKISECKELCSNNRSKLSGNSTIVNNNILEEMKH